MPNCYRSFHPKFKIDRTILTCLNNKTYLISLIKMEDWSFSPWKGELPHILPPPTSAVDGARTSIRGVLKTLVKKILFNIIVCLSVNMSWFRLKSLLLFNSCLQKSTTNLLIDHLYQRHFTPLKKALNVFASYYFWT